MSSDGALTLKVLTPEGIIFKEDGLNAVNVPLADGCPIGIHPGHAPLIAETEQGTIRFRSTVSNDEIHLHAGVLDIRDNVVTVLTAGEVENTSRSIVEPTSSEYDRLMQTLIEKIHLKDEAEQEIK